MDINELKTLSLQDVAVILGFSEKTLRNRISEKKEPFFSLPVRKIGGKTRIPVGLFKTWMARQGLLSEDQPASITELVDQQPRRGPGRPRKIVG